MRIIALFSGLLLILMTASPNAAALEAFDNVTIHGFISQGYLISDENNYLADSEDGSFEFNEIGLSFLANLADNLHLGIQFLSIDLGPANNNEIEIDWAYADWRWKNWLGLRAGIIRGMLGFYNETREADFSRTTILLPQSIYNEFFRDRYSQLKGGSVYGEIDLRAGGSLSYQALIGTDELDDNDSTAFSFEAAGLGDFVSSDAGTAYNLGVQWFTPLEGLRFGTTFHKVTEFKANTVITTPPGSGLPPTLPITTDFTDLENIVYSVEYTFGDFVLAAEYARTVTAWTDFLGNKEKDIAEGYYAQVSYRFNEWLEMATYYSVNYPDKEDKDGDRFADNPNRPDHNAWLRDWALALRFDINDNWIAKVEGHVIDGSALLLAQENPDGYERNWLLFAAKLTFNF